MNGGVPDGIFLDRPDGADAVPAGRRLAVKDLFDTAGLVTTYGSILFADHRPATTAEAVGRLERAGYVDVGKTNLHEFAYGVTSINPHFGTVPNPLARGRIAGGSSGGSAAALALGARGRRARQRLGRLDPDPGGLLRRRRIQAHYGPVPLDGCFPLAPSFDHAGPLARTVAGCVRLMELLAPVSRRNPSSWRSSGRHRLARARRPARPRARRGSRGPLPATAPPSSSPSPGPARLRLHARGGRCPRRALRGAPRGLRRGHAAGRSSAAWPSPTPNTSVIAGPRGVPPARSRGPRGPRPPGHADARLRRAEARPEPHADRRDDALHLPVQRVGLARTRTALRRGGGRPARIGPARRSPGRRRARAGGWSGPGSGPRRVRAADGRRDGERASGDKTAPPRSSSGPATSSA